MRGIAYLVLGGGGLGFFSLVVEYFKCRKEKEQQAGILKICMSVL